LRVEAGKTNSFLCQLVKSWRLVLLVAITAQVRIALVIGKDDQDVGPLWLGLADRSSTGQQ
jgi:hypothetical protein